MATIINKLSWAMRKKVNVLYSQCYNVSYRAAKQKPKSRQSEWESVIGLEIHAQIASKSKLFSGAGTTFAAPINTQVAYMDAALPGTLPVLNQKCVEAGVMTALALKCRLNMVSRFDRKHYFYADLPAGYQITQQRQPLAVAGSVEYLHVDPDNRQSYKYCNARITQLQLEQDSGKSLHDATTQRSLIDLNRAGMGLMEIVTEPDFRSANEAAAFVKELQLMLQALGTCDGKMSEGSLRVDASVSLRRHGEELGVRAEVKNINSIKHVAKAINYEIERQTKILDSGQEITNETRAFDFETGTTIAIRDKEKVHDYRFLPEPNLLPLVLRTNQTPARSKVKGGCDVNVDDIRARMAELPDQTRQRLKSQYGLSMDNAIIFVTDRDLCNFFEAMLINRDQKIIKIATNLLLNDLLGLLSKHNIEISASPLSPDMMGDIADMLATDTISLKVANKVMAMLLVTPGCPRYLVEANNWTLLTDPVLLAKACEEVIKLNKDPVLSYQRGKKKVFNFLMGQLQRSTQGRASPKLAAKILEQTIRDLKEGWHLPK